MLLSVHVKNRFSEVTEFRLDLTVCLFVRYPSTDTLLNTLVAYIVATGKLPHPGPCLPDCLIDPFIGLLTSCVTLVFLSTNC